MPAAHPSACERAAAASMVAARAGGSSGDDQVDDDEDDDDDDDDEDDDTEEVNKSTSVPRSSAASVSSSASSPCGVPKETAPVPVSVPSVLSESAAALNGASKSSQSPVGAEARGTPDAQRGRTRDAARKTEPTSRVSSSLSSLSLALLVLVRCG